MRSCRARLAAGFLLAAAGLLAAGFFAATATASTQGEAIVAAAQAMENQGYPYCFDGGNTHGPTVGTTDSDSDGSYSNCASIGKVGFDCTGLTLYAVYQGTGNAGLSHDGYQAKSGGGQVIASQSSLQPGDVVYFDYNAGNGLNYIDHAGIYVGGGEVLSAVSEKYGIRTESIAWYEAGGLHFVGGVRFWSSDTGPPPPPPPVHHPPFDVNGDGNADLCFLTGLNGGSTGSGKLEVHCALGPGFSSRVDVATPFGYLNTQTTAVLDSLTSAPLAPGGVAAHAGDRTASVSFSAPPYDGGNPLTGYTVTSSPGGITATGSSSPITVSGLTDGTNYTFTVTAANAFGPGLPSVPSNSVMPTAASPVLSASAKRCVVPRLRNLTLSNARRALQRAHCHLGKVRRPKHLRRRHVLRVSRQSAKHGTRHHNSYRVAVTLR